MKTANDYYGYPLGVGDRVMAWEDGSEFTGTVVAIGEHRPGDGDFRPVVLERDEDHVQVERFSDQMQVIG
jgi:hypothetical protein